VALAARQLLVQEHGGGPGGLGRIQASGRFWEKIARSLESCFPPPVTLAALYRLRPGTPTVYLYYPRRLVDLVLRYAGLVWRLLRRESRAVAVVDYQAKRARIKAWLAEDAQGAVGQPEVPYIKGTEAARREI
jgi:hypothetical protein